MKIYDITVPITSDMPVWPGDPGVEISSVSTIAAGDSSNVSHLSMTAHTGTHVDAPKHFIEGGDPLDAISLQRFIGEVQVVEVMDADLITAEILEALPVSLSARRVLFKTRNSAVWARKEKAFQENFVALSPDGAQYLVDRKVDLVGIDYLSIAPYRQSTPTHRLLLGAGILILEGIDLSEVEPGDYFLYCLPMNLIGVDGAPARAILVRE
jgi:arylformamidase